MNFMESPTLLNKTLELAGYHQARVYFPDISKTAFHTYNIHYKYLVIFWSLQYTLHFSSHYKFHIPTLPS